MEMIFKLMICHLIGDYVLQSNFLATTKGQNFYHLFVQCCLYIVPFYFMFGLTWQLLILFTVHIMLVDALKARCGMINYVCDQIIHYICLGIYFI